MVRLLERRRKPSRKVAWVGGFAPIAEAARCREQLHGRVPRLVQTVRWGSPRCSDCRPGF